VSDLGIPFSHPYTRTFDDSKGIQWTTWFSDGQINITSACVDRWRATPADANSLAIISEGEDGKVEQLTFEQLGQRVDELAGALRADGVKPGDAVAVFMPMVPDAVVAAYAVAKIGAIFLPIFSGFAAGAITSRIQDASATTVLTAAGSWRKGKSVSLLVELNKALADCPSVRRVVILPRDGISIPESTLKPSRDMLWADFLSKGTRELGRIAENTNAEDKWMVIYTSGTTGKPKGCVHVHGGFLVKIASEAAYALDIRKGDRFQWITDMGWIMGPLTMIGAHAMGATMVMLEGAPDYPNPSRVWKTAADHQVTFLGISPTLIRALKSAGDQWTQGHDLSHLRSFGSTGEPWNPEPYLWLFKELGNEQLPIINISGGTEVGACFLTAYPVEPLKVCTLGGPCLGVDIDVFDPEGNSVRGKLGELVCKAPWPGMTRGIFNNTQRYLDSYWSMYPNIWRHGDWALVDHDGSWFLHGRSDEAVNVAGKRIGPSEVESVLVGDPAVIEAAMVGVPDDLKGECIWCFWVPVDPTDTTDLTERLNQRVIDALGRPFAPARIIRVPALPKTRSAKILRRAVRALAMDVDPGDLSSAENPESLVVIKQIIKNLKPQ